MAGCLGDSTGPGHPRVARLAVAPVFHTRSASIVDFTRVRITLSRETGTARDTIVDFPQNADSLVLTLEVPITGSSETFALSLAMINAAGDTVFRGGPVPVTATAGAVNQPVPVSVTVRYVGVGSNAAAVRIAPRSVSVFFGDTVRLVAAALDSSGQPIPGTPIIWRSLDSLVAHVAFDTSGTVVAGAARGAAPIEAALLTDQADTVPVTVEPVPSALLARSGASQTAVAGDTLPQPVTVRVNAADGLGVSGIVVDFAVTGGGGTVTNPVDTTDANGDASTRWVLGDTVGAQTLSATVSAMPGLNVTIGATGAAGSPTQLVFVQQPLGAMAGAAIAPIIVEARDANGHLAPSFTDSVTVAITAGSGTAGAVLSGTKTVAAIGGVATFADLAIDKAGTGYTLTASSGVLSSATSASFDITAGGANQLAFTTQPASTTAGVRFGVVVTARDSLGNTATGFAGNVSVAITGGTGTAGAALRGTTTVTAQAGVATFSGLSIDSAGTGYRLTASASGAATATSVSFAVSGAPASQLAFTVEPPGNVPTGAPFAVAVAARDSLGNAVTSFTGSVSVAIAANPASGTLSGTLSHNAVSGVASFSGLSIDNIGSGYTLAASATGLVSDTSIAFNVLAPGNVNAWINPAGGNWSVASNWSRGTVPTAVDTVTITQSGTYTVNVDANAAFARLDMGAPSGTQTLSVAANTLTGGDGALAGNTVLSLSGSGTITGGGTLATAGTFDWTGGSIGSGGTAGTIQVLAGGTLTIGGSATHALVNHVLELAGSGTWTGAAALNSGSGGTLRVLAGGTLNLQGDPTFAYNLGGAAPLFDNQGVVTRTTSLNAFTTSVPVGGGGAWNVQSGTLDLEGGGSPTGSLSVASGATLQLGGTLTTGPSSAVTGAGTVIVSGGSVAFGGGYGVTGATQISGGTANFDGASDATAALSLTGGTLGGSGLLTVSGPMSWTGGSLSGAGGTTRVLASGTLSIAPAANVNFQSYTLELAGTGTWTGTATVNAGSAAILRVLGGGTLDVQGDPSFAYDLGGAAPALDVLGTLTRSASANPATLTVQVNDSGTVNVQSGALQLGGGGTSSGAYAVSSGATLAFTGGTHSLGAGSNVSGAGTLTVGGGTLNAGGGYDVTGTTQIAGGTANFDGASGTTAALTVSGGTLGGSGLLTVSGPMGWSGGSLSGAGGTTRVLASGTLGIAPTANVNFQSYTLELAGAGTWTGTATVNAGSAAILRVLGGATLDIQGDPSFAYDLGGAAPSFDVLGTLARTTSPNAAVLTVAVNDSGTVSVQSGTLRLAGGGASSGAYAVSTGAVLDFGGGTHALAAAASIGGAGAVGVSGGVLNSGGAYAVTGSTQIDGGTANLNGATSSTAGLTVTGGALGGSGLLTVSGPMSWTGGGLLGAGGTTRVLAGGTLSLAPVANVNLQAYTLELAGTGTWTGTATMNSGGGAVLRVLAGGVLDIQGDPTFAYNLGGASSLLENLGTLDRSTSTGTVTVAAPFNLGGTASIQSGIISVTGGGTMSGAVNLASATVLQFTAGSTTLANNFRVTGTTGYAQVAGSAVLGGLTATDTAFFDNLQLAGGTISLGGGTIKTPVSTIWNGSATVGGGTLFIPAGAALSFAFTGSASLQNATILNGGGAVFTTSGTLNTGSGAVIRNLAGATFAFTAAGSVPYNLGGTASLFDNQGTLTSAPLSGNVVIGAQLSNTGTVQVASDTLRFTNGSAGSLVGTVTVTAGAALDFGGGAFAQTGPLQVNGDLVVSAGQAVPGGYPLGVAGSFTTMGTGALRMTLTNDSVGVGGNATFAGGSTAGLLTSGILTVDGDFTQAGNSAAFAPSGTFETDLTGSGTQNVSFANPGTSLFQRLAVLDTTNAARDVVLQTNVVVADSLIIPSSTWYPNIVGAGNTQRLTVRGILYFASGEVPGGVTPPVLELAAFPSVDSLPSGSVGLSPDTLVLLPGVGTLPTGIGVHLKNVRVSTNGAVTLNRGQASQPDTIAGNLTIDGSSGLALGAATMPLVVTGNLTTAGSGTLQIQSQGTQLYVNGTATFAGGSTSGLLTAGALLLGGDLVQAGNPAAFAPSGAFNTTLTGTGTQNLSFANPTTSHFAELDVPSTSPRSVVLLTDVVVGDSLQVLGGAAQTTMTGAGTSQHLTVNGLLRVTQSTTSPLVAPPVLELAKYPAIDSIFIAGAGVSPDTLVLLPGITTVPVGTPIHLRSLRASTNALVTLDNPAPNRPDTLAGDLVIDGTTVFAISEPQYPLTIMGNLATAGSGVLQMQISGMQVVVKGSATFAGGSTAGQLTQGSLYLAGNLTQAGDPAAFAPDPAFSTYLTGTTPAGQQIAFANPGLGAGTSHFSYVEIDNVTGPITLNSPVFATVTLADSVAAGESITGTATTPITVEGVYLTGFKIDGAPLVVLDTATEVAFQMNVVTFGTYDPTVDQLTVEMRGDLSASTTGVAFSTPPTSGHYLNLQWIAPGVQGAPPTLTMTSALPQAQGGTSTVIAVPGSFGTPVIVWP
jgi:hypothetical protein